MTSDASENTPLLGDDTGLPPTIARRLYTSHFLSTWNSRVFEFGSVLYLATIFPGTLLPMSLYAFARGLSAVVLSPLVGRYIDTGERLSVVRLSIVLERLAVAASCVVFYLLTVDDALHRNAMLALLSLLACVEKICSIMNMVAVEKDWVVVIAGEGEPLRTMNAQMRRIDLLCKLFGPLFIALIDGWSTKTAIIINFGMNVVSVGVEYLAIAWVYRDVPALQAPKHHAANNHSRPRHVLSKFFADFGLYFRHKAFLPSFAGALLYLTVLSFSGQMVTYLLTTGYSSTQVGIARTASVIFEVASTWVAPWLMARIGTIRAGLWLSNWQFSTLLIGISVFWTQSGMLSASGLVVSTALSRIGLRGFDLCVQVIVQEEVEEQSRGAFSAVEASWQNAFELLSFAATMVFARPEEFRWPGVMSVVAVGLAVVLYAVFVRRKRGHLVHLEKLGLGELRERILERIR